MLHTRTQSDFGTWGIPGRKPVIVYALATVSRLAAEARKASPGPVGGVLFGVLDGTETRITAHRPVECRSEPESDTLFTEAGEAALGQLSKSWESDPELAGLVPLGWYRSRWESAIQLDQEDLRIWNHYFPDVTQVSLVLRVHQDFPVRAGFFFRPQHGGPVRIDSSYRTFEIDPPGEATSGVGQLAEAVKSEGQVNLLGTEAVVDDGILAPPPDLFTPPQPPPDRSRYLWAAGIVLCLAVLTFVGLSWWSGNASARQPIQEVGLRFKGSPDRLQLVWNPQSALIRQAARAELRLMESGQDSTELIAGPELNDGARSVTNRSGLIEAEMRIYPRAGNDVTVVAAEFVGPTAAEVRHHDIPEADQPPASRAERVRLQVALDAKLKANASFEDRIRRLRDLVLARTQARDRAIVTPVTTPVATPPQPQARTEAPAQAAPPAAAPPASNVVPDQGPAFGSDRVPSRAVVPVPEPPATQAYSGPTSGKFIWTGYLAPGRTITIDGRRASSGSVNGSLPGVPVRVVVYPGEFSTSGLSVYSASPRHQTGTVTEGRNSQNGWMNTRYVYDPARARDAQISAAPNESGGYRQIQIVGGERPVSVVVVEWAIAR